MYHSLAESCQWFVCVAGGIDDDDDDLGATRECSCKLLHASSCQSLARHVMHAWGAYHRASAIHHDANVHALLPGLKVPYDRLHATGPHT